LPSNGVGSPQVNDGSSSLGASVPVQEYPLVASHSRVGSAAHVSAMEGSRTLQQKSVEPMDSLPGSHRRRLSVSQGLAAPVHEKA
jgi:hypothetical protein